MTVKEESGETRVGRQVSDLHLLWRLCGRPACFRARACRGDYRDCIERCLPLVPESARGFIAGFAVAQDAGMPFDDMFDDLSGEWQALEDWRRTVEASLPHAPRPPADGA